MVLSHDEVARVLAAFDDGPQRLLAELLYGTGMRLLEGLRLRTKDIDFERRAIVVREGKGAKDRVVMLPASLEAPLRTHLAAVHRVWASDRAEGLAGVHVPHALERKYPRAASAWAWFWVFPQVETASTRARVAPPPPPARQQLPARLQACRRTCRHPQARDAAHLAPFVRHPPAAVGLRHPHRAGTARPRRCHHDDDLHPCAAAGGRCRAQPARQSGRNARGAVDACGGRTAAARQPPRCAAGAPGPSAACARTRSALSREVLRADAGAAPC